MPLTTPRPQLLDHGALLRLPDVLRHERWHPEHRGLASTDQPAQPNRLPAAPGGLLRSSPKGGLKRLDRFPDTTRHAPVRVSALRASTRSFLFFLFFLLHLPFPLLFLSFPVIIIYILALAK